MPTYSPLLRIPRTRPHGPARAGAGLAALVAWAGLSLLGGGCSHTPSTVTALAPPGDSAREAFGPAIACDPVKHDVLLAWISGDPGGWRVWFARSTDRGATWSVPVIVSPPGEPLRLDPESSPRMLCDPDGRVAIAWSTWTSARASALGLTDLRVAHSPDGGRHWSEPVTVNDDTTSGPGNQSFHDLALRPDGPLFAAWLDSRPGSDTALADTTNDHDASIWFARSEDFGGHWGPNAAHWSGVVPNCRVSLVVDGGGSMFAAFRKHFPGEVRDIVLARPGGPPVRMHDDEWKVADCPPSGPAMTLSRDGTLRLVWYTGAARRAGVWFRQNVPELMDSVSEALPVLVADQLPIVHIGVGEAGMSGTLIACDADSTGANRLTLARVEASGRHVVERFVVPGTRGVTYPSVASERTTRTAYVVWTHHGDGPSRLRLARWNVGR